MITGGYHNNGGGILNRGTLILESGRIEGNTALHTGGGITNDGTMILLGGSVTGNKALRKGGGVCNKPKGHLTICGDLVRENDAPKNEDIFNQGSQGDRFLDSHTRVSQGTCPPDSLFQYTLF